jgi:hypothetical protein
LMVNMRCAGLALAIIHRTAYTSSQTDFLKGSLPRHFD